MLHYRLVRVMEGKHYLFVVGVANYSGTHIHVAAVFLDQPIMGKHAMPSASMMAMYLCKSRNRAN